MLLLLSLTTSGGMSLRMDAAVTRRCGGDAGPTWRRGAGTGLGAGAGTGRRGAGTGPGVGTWRRGAGTGPGVGTGRRGAGTGLGGTATATG